MAIDTASYINEMNENSPFDQDNRSEGAGQIRAVKSVLKRTFKWVNGEDNMRPNLPIGFVGMYSGTEANLERGWALCDGRTVNGVTTPNLTNKFIMGSTGFSNIGAIGGNNIFNGTNSAMKTTGTSLDISQMPTHTHPMITAGQRGEVGHSAGSFPSGAGSVDSSSTNTNSIQAVGGGLPHEHTLIGDNRPEFYVLSYIMFVGMYE